MTIKFRILNDINSCQAGTEFEMREICVSGSADKIWPKCGRYSMNYWYRNFMNYGFFLFENVSVRTWFWMFIIQFVECTLFFFCCLTIWIKKKEKLEFRLICLYSCSCIIIWIKIFRLKQNFCLLWKQTRESFRD